MKFTPGPWKLSLQEAEYTLGKEEAKQLKMHGLPTRFNAISVGSNNGKGAQMAIIPLDESNQANGYLIAAAPEMYEVIKSHCKQCLLESGDKKCEVKECTFYKAVAKAEGK